VESAQPQPPAKPLPPLDRAYAEFQSDRAFAGKVPTREQVARAWALAVFQNGEEPEAPSHEKLVAALREVFPEFKEPRSSASRVRR
jgi:hypothetical protein